MRGREERSVEDLTGAARRGMSPEDERVWATLSHASVLAWPFTGFLPVVPLIIWLLYKDRSARVGFHAAQSLWYQAAWAVIFVAAGTIGVVGAILLTIFTLGLALIPLSIAAVVLGLWPFVHQLYAAYSTFRGGDPRYPFIADRL